VDKWDQVLVGQDVVNNTNSPIVKETIEINKSQEAGETIQNQQLIKLRKVQ
jgi:hypothetical protein